MKKDFKKAVLESIETKELVKKEFYSSKPNLKERLNKLGVKLVMPI